MLWGIFSHYTLQRRFEDALKKLTADLEMKIAQRDELKEKQRLQKEGVMGEVDDTDQDQDGPINDDDAGDENLFGSDDPAMDMDIGWRTPYTAYIYVLL